MNARDYGHRETVEPSRTHRNDRARWHPFIGTKIQIRRRGTPAIYVIVHVLHVVDDIKDEPIAQTTKALISGESAVVTAKLSPQGFADVHLQARQ